MEGSEITASAASTAVQNTCGRKEEWSVEEEWMTMEKEWGRMEECRGGRRCNEKKRN